MENEITEKSIEQSTKNDSLIEDGEIVLCTTSDEEIPKGGVRQAIFDTFAKIEASKFRDISNVKDFTDADGCFALEYYLNSDDCDFGTIFMRYCILGHLDVVQYLLGAFPNKVCQVNNIMKAAYNAAYREHLHVVAFLIEHFKITDIQRIALATVENDNVEIFKALIPCTSYVNNDLVMRAVKFKCNKIIKHLVSSGIRFDYDKAIFEAVKKNNLGIFKFLSNKHKIDPARTKDIFEECCRRGNLRIIKLILEDPLNFSLVNGVIFAAMNGRFKVVKHLTTKFPTLLCNQVLIKSVVKGDIDMVKYLIKKRAPISYNIVNYAVNYGHLDIVKYLIGRKIRFDLIKAITQALNKGYMEMVAYLLNDCPKNDANLFKIASDVATKLALENGNLEQIRFLIENCPSIDKNRFVAIAEKTDNVEIIECVNSSQPMIII